MTKTALFWFNNDLRLHDQPGLWQLANQCDRLLCVYCIDPQWFKPNGLNSRAMGKHRQGFLLQSLAALQQSLNSLGQTLLVVEQNPVTAIADLIRQFDVSLVGRSRHSGLYEQRQWTALQQAFADVDFFQRDSFTLFDSEDLPFSPAALPGSFSQFRRRVEQLPVPAAQQAIREMPASPLSTLSTPLPATAASSSQFAGGESDGLAHVSAYFSGNAAASYKHTRNALDGWDNSSKFSPWLANGSVSVRHVHSCLRRYEQLHGANESTEWLFLELLWREYFQYYADKHGHRLFAAAGITSKPVRCCFYPERYQRWCHGNTPYPLVNALMHELNATGYMSNRGRQIVASAFIHELKMDWRYGAAYFEQQLIDFDMAVNWGNWQYIAGVGADPRGGRHFNLDKQTRDYDPDGRFIEKWQGGSGQQPLDSVDAADWPILPPKAR